MISGNDNDPQRLFPLPLNSMEKFHLFDHSRQFLNIILCRLRFQGTVDPVAADRAFQLTVERHPLWQCCIEGVGENLQWVWAPGRYEDIDWHEPMADAPGMRQFDSCRQPGGLPLSRIGDGQTEISLFAQHVLCDGAGGTQFVGDWMRFYHNLVAGNDPGRGIKALQSDLLLRRGRLDLFTRQYLKHLWKQPLGLYGAAKFVGRKPVQLGAVADDLPDWDYQHQPWIISRWIDQEVSQRLKRRALASGVTVNSLLIAELFRTIHAETRNYAGDANPCMRILLPMSLRTFADRRMTSTNRATVVQIDRRQTDFLKTNYVHSIDREIGIIRNWHLNKLFLLAMDGMSLVPGALRRASRSDKCRGTVIFANLSEPFGRLGLPIENGQIRVGNLLLRDIDMAGPIRHRTPANFTFLKHINRHRLSLHADPRFLSVAQATALVDDFCQRIGLIATT